MESTIAKTSSFIVNPKNVSTLYSIDAFQVVLLVLYIQIECLSYILICREGKSRQFAFIGYRSEQEAIKYLNKSFIDTSRISLEVCTSTKNALFLTCVVVVVFFNLI